MCSLAHELQGQVPWVLKTPKIHRVIFHALKSPEIGHWSQEVI